MKINEHPSANQNGTSSQGLTLWCKTCSTISAYAHCNNCNENGDNSSVRNGGGLQIAAGPDPIIITTPGGRGSEIEGGGQVSWILGNTKKNNRNEKWGSSGVGGGPRHRCYCQIRTIAGGGMAEDPLECRYLTRHSHAASLRCFRITFTPSVTERKSPPRLRPDSIGCQNKSICRCNLAQRKLRGWEGAGGWNRAGLELDFKGGTRGP